MNKQLGQAISAEFQRVSSEFSSFQSNNKLECFEGCGKCCFNSDVNCSPIELLPMAYDILDRGDAEKIHEMASNYHGTTCFFLDVENFETGRGKCREYKNRPLVCRSFGVAARKDKNGSVEFSVCKPLKEGRSLEYNELIQKDWIHAPDVPYIEKLSSRLCTLDPAFLDKQHPINESLVIILEKIMMHSLFSSDNSQA